MSEQRLAFRIMIVDDNPDDLDLIGEAIKETGLPLELIAFTKGEAAFAYLCQGRPVDLVISDLNMPRVSGIDLLTRIAAEPSLSHIPLALTSSSSQGRLPAHLTEQMQVPYLFKSAEWSGYLRLAREIYQTLSSRGQRTGRNADAQHLATLMRTPRI